MREWGKGEHDKFGEMDSMVHCTGPTHPKSGHRTFSPSNWMRWVTLGCHWWNNFGEKVLHVVKVHTPKGKGFISFRNALVCHPIKLSRAYWLEVSRYYAYLHLATDTHSKAFVWAQCLIQKHDYTLRTNANQTQSSQSSRHCLFSLRPVLPARQAGGWPPHQSL